MNLSAERVELIGNGVDVAHFREMPKSETLIARYNLSGKRIVLSVGRLIPRKGFDRMLTAFPGILRRHPDAHYLVVGDGPYRADLERIARELEIEHCVTFAGDVPDSELVEHYSLCEIFAMPNREMPNGDTEGFGLVFLEANACGKPVIAGLAGGTADAVTCGVNGLSVDGDSPAAITDAVDRLLADRELWSLLRIGGLSVAQNAGWQERTDRFKRLCVRLLA
jgi:phosphatidylinositol alpha-1,6-mannosyltransferase